MDNIESFQIVMARKPLQGAVADNVTTWGVGGLNIDGCRVSLSDGESAPSGSGNGSKNSLYSQVQNSHGNGGNTTPASGRWPANVILDESAGEALDEQSGERKSGGGNKGERNETAFFGSGSQYDAFYEASTGGASRFFYNSDTVDPIIERTNMHYQLLHGDNREQLKHLADNSIDSIVCDPPYELGFMGKRWDSNGIAYDLTVWAECLRVLKPGGHLIAFGGTRTYHRMTVAIEDAGFEIRDCIMWLYGSGFPKSHDVSKALDKQAGAEREVFEKKIHHPGNIHNVRIAQATATEYIYSKPATDLAKQWHGWGTALKPAVEPAVLARKPLSGTVADNVTTWGVGGINVDGCRVEINELNNPTIARYANKNAPSSAHPDWVHINRGGRFDDMARQSALLGRWPANVILDESAGEALDEQSLSESSRFFYTAKASKAEREAGLDASDARANHHPTVKPIALMRYLVRLVTPKDGTVLDPFMGSGSTGCAAMCEGVNFVGIELSEEYLEIARRRIEYWQSQNPMGL